MARASESEEQTLIPLPRFVRQTKYEEMSGISVAAQRQKRASGQWLEGRECQTAPDGKVMINWREVDRWVEGKNK